MTVYYHHWIGQEEKPIYNNLRVPIVLSIATLRAVNPNVPIVVFEDISNNPHPEDWAHFPDKLNFEVRQIPFYLSKNYSWAKGNRFLSRIFDLRRHAFDVGWGETIYCDSDVFWLQDPLPLACNSDRFCFDGYNTGYFYYRPSKTMDQFFELFEAYTIVALNNEVIREMLKTYVGYELWHDVWDEMTLTYIAHQHSDLIQRIPAVEHATVRKLESTNLANTMKMLHCNGLLVANPLCKREGEREHCRGITCLIIKELYERLCSVLNEDDLRMIFTEKELYHYRGVQFSITDEKQVGKLLNTRSEDGHYHLDRMCDDLFRSQLLA